jgi:hypothetical protein
MYSTHEAITRIAGRVQHSMRYSEDGDVDPIETTLALRREFPFADQDTVNGCAWRAYLMGERGYRPTSAAHTLLRSGGDLGPRDVADTLGLNNP